jgi:PKD repeat protein
MSKHSQLASTRSSFLHLLLGLVLLLGTSVAGFAQQFTCSEGRPAFSVPASIDGTSLWGSLRPGDQTGGANERLPDDRDSTDYTGNNVPGLTRPLFSSVDVEGDWVFASYATGFRIYSAGEKPQPAGTADLRTGLCDPSNLYPLTPECTEIKHFFNDIDAPEGKHDIVAMAGLPPVGMIIANTANKSQPFILYQDIGKGSDTNGTQVYSATIGGRDYAFLAANVGALGLHLYDMTAARSLNRCLENSSTGPLLCSGVYKGRIGGARMAVYVDGVATSSGHFIAVSSGGFGQEKGVEIWNVSNPNSPISVGRFLTAGSDAISHGVALWEKADRQYLAIHIGDKGQIFDITDCLPGGCTSLPKIWERPWTDWGKAPNAVRYFVTFSRSGNTPFLYFGAADQCGSGLQREFLFNVSNASNPDEITPENTVTIDGKVIDYWGWYYSGNYYAGNGTNDPKKHGFSRITPAVAKFGGNVLYRAASTIFDTHVWTQATPTPPIADFSWTPQTPIYAGDPVTFTDTSIGGAATAWTWTFQDGTPASATSEDVGPVTFNPTFALGQLFKDVQVTHGASNAVGPDETPAQKPVRVFSPLPNIGSVGRDVANPLTCQAVTFTANEITGKPAPTVAWEIRQGGSPVPAGGTGSGSSFTLAGSALPAGSYTAVATATSGLGAAEKTDNFTLIDPPALGFNGAPTCTNCTNGAPPEPPFGVAQLNITATGATDYSWDFGSGFTSYSDSQYNKPNPSFSYSSLGQRTIRVKIKNCTGAELTSDPITINIARIDPVQIVTFAAVGCPISFCPYKVNQAITFTQVFSGGPTTYQYDWEGIDGQENFTPPTTTPVTSHAYATTGIKKPKVRVQRGTEPPVTFEHAPISIEQGQVNNPSISVSGNGGNVNTALTFTASAANCTAGASGWTWSTDGGTGSSTSSSISITWATAGSKTVTAQNSGCGNAKGTRTVTITQPTNQNLGANFTFSPTLPRIGETVSFDASSSTGAPTGYTWTFPGNVTKNGVQVTHTFTTPGPNNVQLEVAKAGSCVGGFCTASTSKQVVVTGGPPVAASLNSESCQGGFGALFCNADVGKEMTFTDASTGNIVSRTWSFGDGETATGTSVKHTYDRAGSYQLTLTVSDGTTSDSITYTVLVTGGPLTEGMVLPWIAKTVDGALVQSSDFYLHNPSGSESIDVTLKFRQRGSPEPNPPQAKRTIGPNATLFVSDAVKGLFGREDVTGFVSVDVDRGSGQPVVMSFNTTFREDGSEFGQTIPGFLLSHTGAASSTGNNQIQHLVGLNDNGERLAYFGFSNPGNAVATYTVRFFDNLGRAIGTGETLTLAPNGAKQFQVKEIRTRFGLSDQDDYRVAVESARNTPLFPYGANLRLGSGDPSFVSVGTGAARAHLLGALSTPGANNSVWRSDLVLANTGSQVVIAELTFTNVGVTSTPTDVISETLQPGETRRLADVIGTKWNIRNGVGVLTIESDAPGGQLPVIQGESYETTNPAKRYGQTLPALNDAQAAGPNQGQYLVGLRQDAKYRTTFWMFNPSNQGGQYDVVFRALDGRELGRLANVLLGPGKLRQLNQAQFPAGVESGFTVQILVKQGKALAAAQVVNNATNDPAYIQGETR